MKNAMALMAASVLCLAVFIDSSSCAQKANKVADPYKQFVGPVEQGARSGWVPQARQWEDEASVARRADTEYQRTLRQYYTGDHKYSVYQLLSLGTQNTPTYTFTSSKTEVDFTPQLIKDQGNENKNYIVMISADWCHWCKKMYPMVQELRDAGYIVYVFEVTRPEFEDYAALYNVTKFPTFMVYDKGVEVDRTIGRTNKDWFTDRVKTKDNQVEPTPEPTPDPYDGF